MSQSKIRLLERTHIIKRLLEAVENYPLVVLTAPMGYGKTTLAREAMRATGRRSFLVTVDPGSHNAAYIWNRACEQLVLQGSDLGRILQNAGFSEDPVLKRRTLSWVREYLKDSPTLLILDDFHHVQEREFEEYIDFITRERIPNLALLLLSRTRPNIPLEELRLKGLATVLRQDVLLFSEEETRRYFSMHGIEDKLAAESAWSFCEGWPAALWLSLHSYQTTGTLRPVEDMEQLLQSTVFSFYPIDDQILLLQLSILDSFSPRQAALVSGDQHAPRRLRAMQTQNAFMTYDAGLGHYRLHSIFRTFLRRRLDEQSLPAAQAIDLPLLYRRIGEWYATERDILKAVYFFDRAGSDNDYLRILQLFAEPGAGLSVLYDPEWVMKVMRSIPLPVLEKCFTGYLAFIYNHMAKVSQEQGLVLLKEVEEYLRREDKAELYADIRGELEIFKGVAAFNDLPAASAHYKNAASLLKGPSAIYNRRMLWNLGSPHTGFLFLRDPGSYAGLISTVEEDAHNYQKISDGCGSGMQDLMRAEYLLETGSFRQVEHLLMKSIYRAGSKGQLSTILAVRFTQARLLLCQGQLGQAWDLFTNMQTPVMAHGNPMLATSLDLCHGYLSSVSCLPESIPIWLRQGNWDNTYGFYRSLCFMHVVHGRYLIMEKNWSRLEALAQDIPNVMGQYKFLFGHIHAQVMLAIALAQAQQKQESRAAMRRAIELARPDNIMLSIAEYGTEVSPLLRSLYREFPDDRFIGSLYRLSTRYIYNKTGVAETCLNLTDREQAIIKRAIAGESNQQIARALKVQPVTIGNSLTRIYKKLGVSNRLEAANVWRGLGKE